MKTVQINIDDNTLKTLSEYNKLYSITPQLWIEATSDDISNWLKTESKLATQLATFIHAQLICEIEEYNANANVLRTNKPE